MVLVFAFVVAPFLIFILTWALVTAYRLYRPEEEAPLVLEALVEEEAYRRRRERESLPVGSREIREDQRYHLREQLRTPYCYASGGSQGLPLVWLEDLHRRQN